MSVTVTNHGSIAHKPDDELRNGARRILDLCLGILDDIM